MTALCGGGASQIKPGTQQWVVVGSSLITAGLGVITPWLIPLAALIDAFNWQALTECTSDPPPMPSSSDLDPLNAIGGVLNPNFNTWLVAVNNLLLNWLWYQFCQCVSGSPTPATYPPPPTNYQFNQQSLTTNCSDMSWQGVGFPSSDLATIPAPSIAAQTLPYPINNVNFSGEVYPCGHITGQYPTSLTLNGDLVSGGGAGVACDVYVVVFNSAGGQNYNNFAMHINSNFPHTGANINLGTNATDIFIFPQYTAGSGPVQTSNIEVIVNCGTGGGTTITPCVTDPAVMTLLNQMWSALKAVYGETTLLQRGLLPFAYTSGAVHAGLTGQGTIAVSSLLGVQVVLTAVPGHFGEEVGEPTVLFDVGWVSVLDANGFIDERRIRATDTVWTPRIMSEATVVGYSFSSGVVATITELHREP